MAAVLTANERTDFKRSTVRKLREDGEIPAVVYGKDKESTPIYINGADFLKTMRDVGRHGILTLDINGKKEQVILSSYQEDPIKKEILHADFFVVDKDTKVQAEVRINLVGEPLGVKDGGVLQQAMHDLSITAIATDIPPSIDIDVTHLQVGDTITVGDIKGTISADILHDDEQVIASILPPKQEEEINTGEEQEPGIPENEEGRETKASEES
jgi:large subunit ribosomal protein L25